MKGEFLRKKFSILDLLSVIGGLFSIGFYVFLKLTVPDDAKEMLFILIIGIVLCLISVLSLLLTSNGYIYVDKDSIKARYSCFWKIDSKLTDVSFASAQGTSLTIQLKNGDTHTIMNITNAWQLASFIRKNIPLNETEQPCILIEKLNDLKNARKKSLVYICFGIVLMFLNIFFTVLLTDGKELNEFGKTDWIIFSIMGAIELITVIVVFCFAQKAGKKIVPIEKMQYTIRRRIIETTALLPGKAISVFTDEDYSERITVFGFSNDDKVYYIEQVLNPDYSLDTVYESEIYEDIDKLYEELNSPVDITKAFSIN